MSSPGFDTSGIVGPPNYSPFYDYRPNQGKNNATFNPTMAVVIIVLIGGSFVLVFISVFVRKCITVENPSTTTTDSRSRSYKQKTRGLDKAAVDALPIVHTAELAEIDDLECPVCLTEFEPEDSLRLLPNCKHIFHQECIDAWFDAHSTCPLCRASLTNQAAVVSNSGGGHGAPREPVEAVVEVSENGDSDIELHPVSDTTREGLRTDTTVSREDERNSARGTLSRNSQSFKRAARGTTALERAASLGAAGAQSSKPRTGSSTPLRQPPLTPSTSTGIRRSPSLGTDLTALRNLLTGGDQNGARDANSSSPGHRLNRTQSAVPKLSSRNSSELNASASTSWFGRGGIMDLGIVRDRNLLNPAPESRSTVDSETGEPSAAGTSTSTSTSTSKGESSKGAAIAGAAPERAWSDRWSLASLRGAVFPLSRSTSDVSSQANPHLPV